MNSNEVVVRQFFESDMDSLCEFFVKAYGPNTIFQNKDFLLYYFDSRGKNNKKLSACYVGVNTDGEVVSHYGGIFFELLVNGKKCPIVWGVNAYTLPEWRGKGINSKMIELIHNNNEVNAVIGMPFDAPFFYKKYGYNIFNKETFSRFVYVLSDKTFEVIDLIGQDAERGRLLLQAKRNEYMSNIKNESVIKLDKNNLHKFKVRLNQQANVLATTYRDDSFLRWRLLENPYINYNVYAFVLEGVITAYIACRLEVLEPTEYVVNRIIDLYGDLDGVLNLLKFVIQQSDVQDHLYVDFSMYGKLYQKELIDLGFKKLLGEDYALLPQVSSPIQNRPNHEFIVIQSKFHGDIIEKLDNGNVYFTRIDGDRDRIARLGQLGKK